nr:cell polarity protein alp11 [Quercus suber]
MASVPHDVPLRITSDNSSSERRITPSWTIAQLKARLEPITGVPASNQRLSLNVGSQTAQPIQAVDEDTTQLAAWPLQAYAELHVRYNLSLPLPSICPSASYCKHPCMHNDIHDETLPMIAGCYRRPSCTVSYAPKQARGTDHLVHLHIPDRCWPPFPDPSTALHFLPPSL